MTGASPVFAADGRPQAMSAPCSTCILRPGGSGLVGPDVVRDLIGRHRAVGAVVTCYQTLDPDGSLGTHHELGYSACAGFLNAYPDTLAAQIAERFLGGWHLIDPPTAEEA